MSDTIREEKTGSAQAPLAPSEGGDIPEVQLDALHVSRLGFDETIALLSKWLGETTPRQVATANLDFLELTSHHDEMRSTLEKSALITADGQPLVWLSHLLDRPIAERVAGSDMVMPLIAEAEKRGSAVFLLGAADGVGDRAAKIMREKHPGLNIVGVASPLIDLEDTEGCEAIAKIIRESGADLLIGALGTPKQEIFLGRYLDDFGCKVVIGVGATLDFISGRVKRAPLVWQKLGVEWLYRFLQEPRRLGGRYVRDVGYLLRLATKIVIDRFRNGSGSNGRPTIGQSSSSMGAA
jgi:N-acetylglucosaminyldiphosphoundecaprenol N-acetyl-beta-D-mannosaminyltransferase